MTRDALIPGFLPVVLASNLYRDLIARRDAGHFAYDGLDHERLAFIAWEQAAAFVKVARRHDLVTAEPDGLPDDEPGEGQP